MLILSTLIIAFANNVVCGEKFTIPTIVPKISMLVRGLAENDASIGKDLETTPKYLNTTHINILVHGLGDVADDAIDQFQKSINLMNSFVNDLENLNSKIPKSLIKKFVKAIQGTSKIFKKIVQQLDYLMVDLATALNHAKITPTGYLRMSKSLSSSLDNVINQLSSLSDDIGTNINDLATDLSRVLSIIHIYSKQKNSPPLIIISNIEKILKNHYECYQKIGKEVGQLGENFKNMEQLVQMPNQKNCVLLPLSKLEAAIDATVTTVAKIWLRIAKEANSLEDDIDKLAKILMSHK